jgi:hypothetical protein
VVFVYFRSEKSPAEVRVGDCNHHDDTPFDHLLLLNRCLVSLLEPRLELFVVRSHQLQVALSSLELEIDLRIRDRENYEQGSFLGRRRDRYL